jgi:hypothetical protein
MFGFGVTERRGYLCCFLHGSFGRDITPSARVIRNHEIRKQVPDMKLVPRFVQYYTQETICDTQIRYCYSKHGVIKVHVEVDVQLRRLYSH